MMRFQDDGEEDLEQGELANPTSIVCRQPVLPRNTFAPPISILMILHSYLPGKE